MEWSHTAQDGKQGDDCGNKDTGNHRWGGKALSRVFPANPKEKSLRIL
jgi:hypothetical protein